MTYNLYIIIKFISDIDVCDYKYNSLQITYNL